MAKKQGKPKASKPKNSGERDESPMEPAVIDEYARKLEAYARQYRDIAEKMRVQKLPVILVGNKKMLDISMEHLLRAVHRASAAFIDSEIQGPRVLVDPAVPTLTITKEADK